MPSTAKGAEAMLDSPQRVMFVIPGADESNSMSFSRRQASSLAAHGLEVKTCFLGSRTSPGLVFKEYRRLRCEIRAFHPDVIHSHFGTVTGFVASLVGSSTPTLITFHVSDLNPAPSTHIFRYLLGRGVSHLA